MNPKKYLFNDYSKFVFSNEDKNISYYESDSNNSYREKKYRSLKCFYPEPWMRSLRADIRNVFREDVLLRSEGDLNYDR